jgi:small-conductance mechanosensitive channel
MKSFFIVRFGMFWMLIFYVALNALVAQERSFSTLTDALIDTVVVVVPDTIRSSDLDSIQETDTVAVSVTVEVAKDTTAAVSSERTTPISIPPPGQIISFSKIFSAIIALIILWLLTKAITAIISNFSEKFSGQRLIIKRLIPITKVLLWSLGLYFIIAGILQPPLETVITVSASIGIAVGFASQDILRNIFGGIMIILDRPFQVGDKIEIDRQYGEVLQIGLRSVRIVTEDDSVVTIPNAEIMNKAVSNANSSAFDCQVVAELFLPTEVDIDKVVQVCRLSALTSRFVYLNKPVFVHTTHITSGPKEYLKVRIKAYVLDIRFEQELRSDITAIALRTLKKRGIISPS